MLQYVMQNFYPFCIKVLCTVTPLYFRHMFTRLRLLPVHNANEAVHTMVNIAKVGIKMKLPSGHMLKWKAQISLYIHVV